MKVYVALIRAINVGGTAKLAMTDLRRLCDEAGFKDCRTYIQSGNAVFRSSLVEASVKNKLEKVLSSHIGKPCDVVVRSRAELQATIKANPWKSAEPSRVIVLFVDQALPKDALKGLQIPGREKVHLEGREIFVHYPEGMGRSKLKVPYAQVGTARNLNSVMKLAAMAAELEQN
jgi:uncharacterized protein (DUF1697 family)